VTNLAGVLYFLAAGAARFGSFQSHGRHTEVLTGLNPANFTSNDITTYMVFKFEERPSHSPLIGPAASHVRCRRRMQQK
jgi:hypothetical protein